MPYATECTKSAGLALGIINTMIALFVLFLMRPVLSMYSEAATCAVLWDNYSLDRSPQIPTSWPMTKEGWEEGVRSSEAHNSDGSPSFQLKADKEWPDDHLTACTPSP